MRRRLIAIVLAAAFALIPSLSMASTIASETTIPAEGETTTTAVVVEPAVPVTEPPATPEPVDWTYRYLIPTLLVLAALVVVATVVQYFLTVVRKRYRVVR